MTTTPTDVQRPPKWKPILAWAALAIGIFAALGSLGAGGAGAVLGGVMTGIAIALPGAMWLHYQRRDQKALADHEKQRELDAYLTPEDRALLGAPPPPALAKRRWTPIAIGSIVLLGLGASLNPVEDSPRPSADTPPSPTSKSTTTTSSPELAPTPSEDADPATPDDDRPPAPANEEEAPPPAAPETNEPPAPALIVPPPAPEPPPAPAPEPAPERTYYANCDEARAAGVAPIYSGQPGYRIGLDRDRDGIACDK